MSINECENGLIDGATPIIIKGVHIASIKTGQVLFGRPHFAYFKDQAENFGYDEDAYMEALKDVPVVTERQFRDVLSFLRELGTMIVELGMNNLEIRETLVELEEEIQERKRTEKALKESRGELRHLSARLLIAHEEERKRIAAELHDCLGSHLTAVRFALETARKKLARGDLELSILDNPISEMKHIIEDVRRIWMDLRPSILDNSGLVAALDWLIEQFVNSYPDIHVTRDFHAEEHDIPEPLKIVIFRIVQEALNNVAKHSGAESVAVGFRKTPGTLDLRIEDNGSGFDHKAFAASAENDRGIGLASMRERTELSGGCFGLESAPGKGVKMLASWPL
jgi:signal transduction histidine kinase